MRPRQGGAEDAEVKRKKQDLMNWSRGLLRLWALATVLWVAAMAYIFYGGWPSEHWPRYLVTDHIRAMAVSAIIPPVVLFALGWAVLWVARGFSRRQP